METLSQFQSAIVRRGYLLCACIYICNVTLIILSCGDISIFFNMKKLVRHLVVSVLWAIPVHIVMILIVFAFFLDTVIAENRSYWTRRWLGYLLGPLFGGLIWGLSMYQVQSRNNLLTELNISLMAGVFACYAFGARRKYENRHSYLVEVVPSGTYKFFKNCGRYSQLALHDTGIIIFFVIMIECGAAFALNIANYWIYGLSLLSQCVTETNRIEIKALAGFWNVFRLIIQLLLFVASESVHVVRLILMLVTSLCRVRSISSFYNFFLVSLVVYMALAFTELLYRQILHHPLRFSRLKYFSSPGPTDVRSRSFLGDALMVFLPGKVPSAQALLSRNLSTVEDSSILGGAKLRQLNVKLSAEGILKGSKRRHLWLETLASQLDVADAILQSVKPSAYGCPQVPNLFSLSSIRGQKSGSGAFMDAALLLMGSLAAHDFSRSARALYTLDKSGFQKDLNGLPYVSGESKDLLENEIDALSLVTKDWIAVAMSSCAAIDAVATQFTLAAAFIEDQLEQNNTIMLVPTRMSEKECVSELFACSAQAMGLPPSLKGIWELLKEHLKILLFGKPKSDKTVAESGKASSDSDLYCIKHSNFTNAPVVVSLDSAKIKQNEKLDNDISKHLQLTTFISSQLIDKGREMRYNSFFGNMKRIVYSYFLRNEISRGGIIEMLLSSVFGLARSKALLESIKNNTIPVCPVNVSSVQSCIHLMEGLTTIVGLELQNNSSTDGSTHVATIITSLLGLQVAIKSHRNAYRKYTQKRYSSAGMQFCGTSGSRSSKDFFAQSEGVVAPAPWVNGDIRALQMALDDAFAKMLLKYCDIIPTYSYPSSYLDELRKRLVQHQ